MSRPKPKLPDQRHLRRAADAAAYDDSNKHIAVGVQLQQNLPPFEAVVMDPATADAQIQELNAMGGAPWHRIDCRTEHSYLSAEVRDRFYLIMHDWWSPLVHWLGADKKGKPIRRDEVAGMVLQLRLKDNTTAEVDLSQLIRDRRAATHGEKKMGEDAKPDAIFFSFEALDKFLFPQLASTYGVMGAWQMRTGIRNDLGDKRPDEKVFLDWQASMDAE